MRKFNISVNGKSYEVDVEEVGGVSTPAPAPVQTAALHQRLHRLQRLHRKLLLLQALSK